MTGTEKFPISIQTFSDIINGGYAYVDKTSYIWKLLHYGKQFFLSRPRRFGKSLFLSTLQAYFEGRRELFKGLDIDREDVDWTPRPVFKFSLNALDSESDQSFNEYFSDCLVLYEMEYGRNPEVTSLSQRLVYLLKTAYEKTGQKPVLLFDEYDAPLLSTLGDEKLNESYRRTLKSILSVLKMSDELISFAFITGVSRFSHTSLFSGANHLEDISFNDEFAAICGITEDELTECFHRSIHDFAKKKTSTDEEGLKSLKENFDGYHFTPDCPDIYNPLSLFKALKYKRIEDFWFQTGTPSYLIEILKRDDFFLPKLDCIESSQNNLSVKESYLNNPIALLFETGYLTIKEYDEEKNIYTLGFPNKEVAVSFSSALMPLYSGLKEYECNDMLDRMRSAVVDGDAERFMEMLRVFLEGNPYGNTEISRRENYFKNNIYLVFKALGFYPRSEEQTCRARMDVMLSTRRFVYVFELKTDGKVPVAMNQIEEKGYALPYAFSGKTIIKIAANYSTKLNNIDSWIIEKA